MGYFPLVVIMAVDQQQSKSKSKRHHDWLTSEDSALRPFLPATLSAVTPAADAAAPVAPLSAEPSHLHKALPDEH